jgi:hypothetical protein
MPKLGDVDNYDVKLGILSRFSGRFCKLLTDLVGPFQATTRLTFQSLRPCCSRSSRVWASLAVHGSGGHPGSWAWGFRGLCACGSPFGSRAWAPQVHGPWFTGLRLPAVHGPESLPGSRSLSSSGSRGPLFTALRLPLFTALRLPLFTALRLPLVHGPESLPGSRPWAPSGSRALRRPTRRPATPLPAVHKGKFRKFASLHNNIWPSIRNTNN